MVDLWHGESAASTRSRRSTHLAYVTAMIMHSVVLLSSMPIFDSSIVKWLARLHPTLTRALRQRGNVRWPRRSIRC